MPTLNYHHLRYFRAVAHDGHLTRTAERLAVSQSALSTQIRKLEEQIGHALFERRGRRLFLTEAGRIALDHADAIFATGEELLNTLGHGGTTGQRLLRVGSLATLSRNFQIEFLRPLLGRDDVEIVIRSGTLDDLLPGLEAHRLDVVLANVAPGRDVSIPLVSHPIAAQPVSLVGVPDRVGGRASLVQRLREQRVILPATGSGIRAGFDAFADRHGIEPRIVAEVDDMAMIRLLAREGTGLAVVPPIVVSEELASGTLVEAGRFPTLSETFHALTLARRFPNPLLRELLGGTPGTTDDDASPPPATIETGGGQGVRSLPVSPPGRR